MTRPTDGVARGGDGGEERARAPGAPPTLSVAALFDLLRDTLSLEHLRPPGSDTDVGLERVVSSPEISSPGLVLAGYVDRFVGQRLQVLGETEVTYLNSLTAADRERVLRQFLRF